MKLRKSRPSFWPSVLVTQMLIYTLRTTVQRVVIHIFHSKNNRHNTDNYIRSAILCDRCREMLNKRRRISVGEGGQSFDDGNIVPFAVGTASDSIVEAREFVAESSIDESGKDHAQGILSQSEVPVASDVHSADDSWSVKVLQHLQERLQELHAFKCKFDSLIGEHVFDARRGSSVRSLVRSLQDSHIFKQMVGSTQSKAVCTDLKEALGKIPADRSVGDIKTIEFCEWKFEREIELTKQLHDRHSNSFASSSHQCVFDIVDVHVFIECN